MRAMPLIIALIAGLVGARERAFHARTGYRWLVVHGPSVWVGIELIRGVIPVLGTWGFAAYALYGQPWLIQPVSIVGVYGLSLLILLVNYALALAALALFDRFRRLEGVPPVEASLTRKWLIGVAIMLLAWTGVSQIALHVLPHTLSIRVAAIQPAFRVRTDEGLRRLSDLTRQAAEQGAELIVWHEGALPFDPQVRHADTLQALAAETGAHLVIGYAVETEAGYRNEAVILTRDGAFLGPFGKDHPVAWSGETSVTRGPYAAYRTDLATLGMMNCYDLDFTDTARRMKHAGAQLIAVPSFDWPAIADKHYTHLIFRAVENRVAAVKADVAFDSFDSAVIGPDGRILARAVTPEGAQEVLVTEVPLGARNAPAMWLGDGLGWLALGGMFAFLALDVTTARRARLHHSITRLRSTKLRRHAVESQEAFWHLNR